MKVIIINRQNLIDKYKKYKDDEYIINFARFRDLDGKNGFEILDYNLTNDEWNVFTEISSLVNQFDMIEKMFYMFCRDISNYKNYIHHIEHNKENDDKSESINYYFIHILSTARLFYVYVDNLFKNKDFEDKVYSKWSKRVSDLYDTDFTYRICYHFRNYTQHKGFIVAIYNESEPPLGSKKYKDVKLYIDLKRLSQDDFNWNKKIREEMKNHESEVELSILIDDYFSSITKLYSIGIEELFELKKSEIIDLLSKSKKIEKIPCIPVEAKILKKDICAEEIDITKYKISLKTGSKALTDLIIKLNKIGLVDIV